VTIASVKVDDAMYSTAMKERAGILNLPLPEFVPRRYRPANRGSWSGHLAFANDLIVAIQPRIIVELGTHWGESYFGFCQSVAEQKLNCLCYAVDHWLGDEHSGFYGEEVYADVSQYNDAYYKAFSYLLRTTFDNALSHFGDGTVELLHIDGVHTYEIGSHDFRSWLPKVRPGGVVLLHDIAVRERDFGIWRLWDEIKGEFPETFEFNHSWGLGVLRKAGGAGQRPDLLEALFTSSASVQERIRRFYVVYASHLENTLKRASETSLQAVPGTSAEVSQPARGGEASEIQIKVYPFGAGEYSEGTSSMQTVKIGERTTLTFDLPQSLSGGRLRVDPADRPAVIELDAISISSESEIPLWNATGPIALRRLELSGTAMLLPGEDKCLILSYGGDPQIILPMMEKANTATRVVISLRLHSDLDAVPQAFSSLQAACSAADAQTATTQSQATGLRVELEAAQARVSGLQAANSAAEAQAAAAQSQAVAAQSQAATAQSQAAGLRVELYAAQAERMLMAAELTRVASEKNEMRRELKRNGESYARVVEELASARDSFASEQRIRWSMEHSRSWQITAPLRSLMVKVRGKPRTVESK